MPPDLSQCAANVGWMSHPDRTLSRIRGLLAKAEHPSTPPHEAEAMSEKAAELMARHAVDRALVDAATSTSTSAAPVARTLRVVAPYAVPKVLLLSGVAAAYRVRTVVAPDPGDGRLCTLVGYPSDLDLVELLFTSLLLQASTAMRLASSGRERVRAFRHAFLMGYAGQVSARIGEAQRRVVDDVTRAAGMGSGSTALSSTALVLADRSDAVDRVVGEMFPRLGRLRATVSDGGGYVAGRAAGASADIATARAVGGAHRAIS